MIIQMFYNFDIHDNVKKWHYRNKDIDTILFNSHGGKRSVIISVGGKDLDRMRRIFHYLDHVKRNHSSVIITKLKEINPLEIYRKLPPQWPLNVHDIGDKSRKPQGELNRDQGEEDKTGGVIDENP